VGDLIFSVFPSWEISGGDQRIDEKEMVYFTKSILVVAEVEAISVNECDSLRKVGVLWVVS
jgi:hypothetical protein